MSLKRHFFPTYLGSYLFRIYHPNKKRVRREENGEKEQHHCSSFRIESKGLMGEGAQKNGDRRGLRPQNTFIISVEAVIMNGEQSKSVSDELVCILYCPLTAENA